MGSNFLIWYKEKCLKSWKIAFFATVVIGLMVHIYKFTNTLLIRDSVFNYYSEQDMTISGRWFLQIACGFSSYFDLPWLNGILSILFIALTMVVITVIFKMDNPVLICISAGILVSYPAITATFFYEYTADGYMIAMLLAALSVYFIRLEEKKIWRLALGGLCLCLSCGIYQAYISFALILAAFHLIKEILEKDVENKDIFKWLASRIAVFASALAAYWVIWKVLLRLKGLTATDYQGISTVGKISFSTIYSAVFDIISVFKNLIFEWDIAEKGLTAYIVFNVIFIALFAVIIAKSIISGKLYNKKIQLSIVVICLVAIPFLACIWQFTSSSVKYYMLMLQSLSLVYIFAAVLCNRWFSARMSSCVAIFLSAVIINFSVMANISYYTMNLKYEETYATAVEMMVRIDDVKTDKKVTSIAFVGNMRSLVGSTETKFRDGYPMRNDALLTNLIATNGHAYNFIHNFVDMDLNPVSDEYLAELEKVQEVQEMGVWPDIDSVKVIGETVVVKLS